MRCIGIGVPTYVYYLITEDILCTILKIICYECKSKIFPKCYIHRPPVHL